jgi:hypothetical protein
MWTDKNWDCVGKWMSFSLAEGNSDRSLYDSKRDTVRHVPDEFRYMYLKLHPGGMTECEAEIMLGFYRRAYDAGFRLADPDAKSGGRDIIPRMGTREVLQQMRAFNGKR